jgi:predicted PurR-regulated permease PerM
MNKRNNIRYISYSLFILLGLLIVPFWASLVVAAIFAFALQPLVLKIRAKTHGTPNKIVIATVILTTLTIIAPIIVGGLAISSQVVELSQSKDLKTNNLPQMLKSKMTHVAEQIGLPKSAISNNFYEKISTGIGETSLAFATSIVTSLPDIVLNLLIFTIGLYLFLHYPNYLYEKIISYKLLSKDDLNELIAVMQTSCIQCLLSLIIIGAIQAAVVALGALIAGFEHLVLIFITTLIFSFVPVIGAAPVAFLLGLWKLMEGESGMAIFLFFICFVAGTIDNVLKPLLVGKGIELDASLTLISIIGAIVLFGIPGLFIGPVVSTAAAYYFKKVDQDEI